VVRLRYYDRAAPDHQTLYPACPARSFGKLRTRLVSRPRPIERLNAALVLDDKYRGLGRKLTLISAPAGFGKITLLSEWL
jgi:ATP/maltotriose-dependent transcriptional regulator MalT